MKRIIPILQLLFMGFLCPAVYAQGNEASKKIIDQLSRFETSSPIEKVYLQFDKPYYAAGDSIYFKAYVTAGERHKLSGISGVLHVDLINIKNKIDQSIKLQLDSGLAWGDFALPDSLPTGNYRVRAYTQWMRNFNETGFFEKTIAIGSSAPQKIPESGSKQAIAKGKPDVQFFPEGGSLVAGIASKVAFKAVDINGLGTEVKGTIVDQNDHEITKFESAHLGMGCFYITPVAGESYKAKLNYADGRQDMIDLPKPETGGITLSLNNDSIPLAMVQIAASADYYRLNKSKVYTLVITSPGSATTVNCKLDSPIINLEILKRKLHTGVSTVTLFSPDNEPLCERLLFIQNYDQLSLIAGSDKNIYAKREKVTIKLNTINRKGDPSAGHFSVSVIDAGKVQQTGSGDDNILTHLLLTSDLKGYIEQPNYYFEDTSITARKNLDVLMLTQGYRRFEWKQVLDSATRPFAFQPEKGITIAGQVTSLFNKPVTNGTITLLPSKGGPVLSTKTDDKGGFQFANLVFADTTHFILSAVNSKKRNTTKISFFDGEKYEPAVQTNTLWQPQQTTDAAITTLAENDKQQQMELLNAGIVSGKMLKEVKIKAKPIDDKYNTQSLAGAGHADQVMHAEEIEQIGGDLSTSLNGRLHGVAFSRGVPFLKAPPGNGPMLVVMDGGQAPLGFNVNEIPSSQIETIEVLRFTSASMYGMGGGNGVLIITTKQGGGINPKDIPSVGVLPITANGFYKAREFYSPKYSPGVMSGQHPDLRSTIYWQPEIKTDANGNASFDFYNADGPGNYKVTVEGIDKDGNIGRQVFKYEVK